MSLNQQVIAEFSPCTPSAPQLRDLSIQTFEDRSDFSAMVHSANRDHFFPYAARNTRTPSSA